MTGSESLTVHAKPQDCRGRRTLICPLSKAAIICWARRWAGYRLESSQQGEIWNEGSHGEKDQYENWCLCLKYWRSSVDYRLIGSRSMTACSIPIIDIADLFGADPFARTRVDGLVQAAAREHGFMVVTGLPSWTMQTTAQRHRLLALFSLPDHELRKLSRWNFDPTRPNVYRGWFPLQDGGATYKEGIDMGPDVAFGPSVVDPSDPLREATPLPDDEVLPGWREAVRDYYLAMDRLAGLLIRSIARGLGLTADIFDPAFDNGISTLRLLRYPVRPDSPTAVADTRVVWIAMRGVRRQSLSHAHVDSGFMTLLAQDGVEGLQAQHLDGSWIDVPPQENALVVNFGKVLELWTGGLIRATRHRVLGTGRERHSIPFFYEARPDAVIAPLPLAGVQPFEPFYFGDYLWEVTTQFVEQKGIAHLRKPQGRPAPEQ
jgi:isopenicillin N synthase-like dioxygenase